MSKRRNGRIVGFAALIALVGALLPAGLASGADAEGDASVVLLTLGRKDNVKWMADTQTITESRSCTPVTFAASPEILRITAIGGPLGSANDKLGVKGSNDDSGKLCGRVEAEGGEAISVVLGSHLDGYLMSAIDVDLELELATTVEVTFNLNGSAVFASSVTDGSGNDEDDDGDVNLRLFVRPLDEGNPVLFDEVVFAPSAGSFSLGGGAQTNQNGMLDPTNDSSQFEVVEAFDGQITCGETITIAEEGIEEVIGMVTMQALNLGTWDGNCTLQKNYNSDITASSLLFSPVLEASQARYTLDLTIDEQPITSGSDGQVTSLIMEYNDGFGSANRPLLACLGQPVFTSAFFEQNDTGLLPAGEFACFYGLSLTPTGNGVGTEAWSIFFEDDPDFNFR